MPDNYELLSQYFSGTPRKVGPGAVDIAKYILLNAEVTNSKGKDPRAEEEPSWMSRIFDVLSRPNYAIAEFVRTGGDPKGLWEGFSGKKKTTFSKVLEENYGMDPGLGTSALGLGLDIFADPLTFLPIGIPSKLRKSTEILDKPYAQKLLNRGDPIHPEAFGLPRNAVPEIPEALRRVVTEQKLPLPLTTQRGFTTSQLTLPGMPNKLKLPEVTTAPITTKITPPVGQLALKFPGFNLKTARAPKIVERVAQGDIESMLRVTPMPKPSTSIKHQSIADDIIKKWTYTPDKKFPETINAQQQVVLYNKSISAAKRALKKSATHPSVTANANKIYQAVEKTLEFKGLVPRLNTGENVRLSDVIHQLGGHTRANEVLSEFGSSIKQGSPTWQAVEALKASGAIKDSTIVKTITDKIGEAKVTTETSGLVSDSQIKDFEKFLKSFSSATARAQDVSPAGIKATESLVDHVLKSSKSSAQLTVEHKAKMLDDIIAKSKANPEVNLALTKALEKDLGTLPKWAVHDNKAAEFIMARVATWWGQRDLRPLSLNAIGSSAATATARGRVLDKLFEPFNNAQRHEAFKLAQGIGIANSPEVVQLATQIKRMMDNLVGQVSGTSVLLRSGVHMEMLNKWMRQYKVGFEFIKGKGKTITGDTVDFSQGTDWVNSWKIATVKDDPKAFLFRIQQAMEQASREKSLFDEIGERFGSQVSGNGYKTKIKGYPYIEGYYFTDDIAKQLPRVVKDWSLPNWGSKSPIVQHYDRVLSMWKAGVTIYRPGHHIRNMVGDIYLGWMDGVNTLKPYTLAVQVQRSMRGAYEDLSDIDKLIEVGVMSKTLGTPKPNQVLFRNKSGTPFTAEQIGAVAHQKGLLEHTRTIEDIIDLGEKAKFKPFGGRVQKVARTASELQSHNTRLAHFIDKITKSRGDNLAEIFEQASRRARKWHPTGLDLTDFEKKVLRRIIPFYSWIRKSTPLLLEGLVMNPGKAVIPSKIYDAIQEIQGIDTPGRHDPFPVDQMFPEWIRAQGVGPISVPEGMLGKFSDQQPPGYVMGGMGLNPLADLMAQLETPGRTIGSSLTPAIQVPIELLTGRKMFTQEPISGPEARPGAMEQYVGEQIPVYSAFQGITGITPFGTETKKSARSSGGGASREALINWLTAAGIRGTGPYVSQAQYERAAPGKMKRKVGREQLMEELRTRLEGG